MIIRLQRLFSQERNQIRMSAQEKGKKKKKTASTWTAGKIGIVLLCVMFAVIMVVTSLGSGWLLSLNPASSGDSVVVGVTFYDGLNRPVLTTSSRTFNSSSQAGNLVWICNQFTMRVNEKSQKQLISVPSYNYYYGEAKYGLFSSELDTIAMNLDGMKQGESKKVHLPSLQVSNDNMTAEFFESIGGNFTTVAVNDQMLLALPENPTVSIDKNVTPEYVIRMAYVTAKTNDTLRFDYAYPLAEISLVQAS
ncbi:MAG: hypothetical protein A4E38_00955 [Methanoregulaceae archaeon PtaB.Bin108]|nr:MAG: hypothetical protein A4E38_00955 [Methanoregulaceae archaeon PtaB.Bin108]